MLNIMTPQEMTNKELVVEATRIQENLRLAPVGDMRRRTVAQEERLLDIKKEIQKRI
jgi:hypothetical protein